MVKRAQRWTQERAWLLGGAALLASCYSWVLYGLWEKPDHPALGWLPLSILTLVAARECWQVAGRRELGHATRRFWRQMSLCAVILCFGVVSNAIDAVGGAEPSQRLSLRTLGLYLAVLVLALWALLNLPTWQRSPGDWVRFGLDACVVLITAAVFAWHFSFRQLEVWQAQTGSTLPLLSLTVLAAVSMLTFVKVAFAGAGTLDRRAMRILSCGAALSAVFGSVSPLLASRPYLSASLIGVSTAALSIQLAAAAQAKAGPVTAPHRSGRSGISVLPYVAVVAADALLLFTVFRQPSKAPVVAVSVVALTVLVAVRQFTALRDNTRLLHTVDANLVQMQQFQEQLSHQATHDALTGIANRTLFEQTVSSLTDTGAAFHVALLDLDDFKMINDRWGHGAGDELIIAVSGRLVAQVGPQGFVARLGGDEFVVVLPGADADEVSAVLNHLVTAVQEPVELAQQTVTAALSIGVTVAEAHDRPENLLRRADVAMYAAKEAGGGGWTWFDPIMDRRADADLRLITDLQQAIARDEFFLMYQPIVGLPEGRTVSVEALLRWRHPHHGLVPPDVFIPLAERSGHIIDIGRWVFEQACRQANAWQARHGARAPSRVSVNVSARQLAHPGIVDEFVEVLTRTGTHPSQLMIEVTETAVLTAEAALPALRDLHDLGFRIALDDFGTGYSSLSLLVECPVDVLKVDKSFVNGVTATTSRAVIVDKLIDITDGLGIDAVAEGVETEEQVQRLYRAGYRYVQGFYCARPMVVDAFDTWLTETTAPVLRLDSVHQPSDTSVVPSLVRTWP